MVRSLALSVSVSLLMVGCVVHTHETPDSSLTSTTSATNAQLPAHSDPHFRVSDQIYSQCELAKRTDMDVAQGTAWCMRTGPLNEKRVRIMGYRDEVNVARDRLVGQGVDADRIVTVYGQGPATIDVVENTIGKRPR